MTEWSSGWAAGLIARGLRFSAPTGTMFHVKRHYVRIDLTVPGVGSLISVADLTEIDPATCRLTRMIEMTPDETITGAVIDGHAHGSINQPQSTVPHPDTYGDFPDIQSHRLTAEEFEALWSEAVAKFPSLE